VISAALLRDSGNRLYHDLETVSVTADGTASLTSCAINPSMRFYHQSVVYTYMDVV
jgi:hypothetical protein